MVKLAVLASGTGSLLASMLERGVPISLVVTDRKCRALDIAQEREVPSVQLVERTDFSKSFDRHGYTMQMAELLKSHDIGLVAMAGFMTIFAPVMFEHFEERVLNTHPSLLPAFPGRRAVEDALAYGVKVTGCTIHVATAQVDAGKILAQVPVPVIEKDTVDTLHDRIRIKERALYPRVIIDYLKELD